MTSWLSKNVVGLRKDSLNRRQLRSATVICAVNGGSEQDGAQVCVCFGWWIERCDRATGGCLRIVGEMCKRPM